MPSPSTVKAVLWGLLVVVVVAFLRLTLDKLRAREANRSMEPVMEVSQPVRAITLPDTCGIVWEGTEDEAVECWYTPGEVPE